MRRLIQERSFAAGQSEILELEPTPKGRRESNDRVFAVPDRSPLETDLKDARHLASHARDELEQFFLATSALEDKKLEFLGWRGLPMPSRNAGSVGPTKRGNELMMHERSPGCFEYAQRSALRGQSLPI
jgi:hypothetical protein